MQNRLRCSNASCGKTYPVNDDRPAEGQVCPKCGAPLTAGAVASNLGRFEIRGKLGSGAFGTVFRGFDPLLRRELAIKVPQGKALEHPMAVARFLREPKAAAQLRHPHIVPVYDAGIEEGRYYIASAFIEGTTLDAAIDERPLDFRQAARTVLDLAEALDYAHRLGVVHRDIKPANIMLDVRGDALLMDFGLARLDAAEELTHDGAVLGTPAYMAPEQAAGNQEAVGPHSDQYSLGVVLYELLCGRRPFSGPPAAVIYSAIHETPPAPRTIRPTVPLDLQTIALKAMAKQPAERFANCQALAADLRRWLDDRPILARKLGPLERARRWTLHNPVLAMLCATVAALAMLSTLTAAGLFFSRGELDRRLASAHALTAKANQMTAEAERQTQRAHEQEGIARQEQLTAEAQRTLAVQSEKLAQEQEQILAATLAKTKQEEAASQGIVDQTAKLVGDSDAAKAAIVKSEEERLRAIEEKRSLETESVSEVAEAAWQNYCRLLTEADAAYSDGDEAAAVKLLESCPKELRGWEWDVLLRLSTTHKPDSVVRSLGKSEGRGSSPGTTMKLSDDGSLVTFKPWNKVTEFWQMPESKKVRSVTEAPEVEHDFPKITIEGTPISLSPDKKRLLVCSTGKERKERTRRTPQSGPNPAFFLVETGAARRLPNLTFLPWNTFGNTSFELVPVLEGRIRTGNVETADQVVVDENWATFTFTTSSPRGIPDYANASLCLWHRWKLVLR